MSLTRILPFQAEHALQIKQQPHDLVEFADFAPEQYEAIAKLKNQFSIEIDGRICACIGMIEYWRNRGEVWAIIDERSGMHFVRIIRIMKKLLDGADCARIEAAVKVDFKAGHRLVNVLGFALEAPLMRKYGVTGWDYSLYARVK